MGRRLTETPNARRPRASSYRMRPIFLTAFILASALTALAQEFEVVSVKPNKSGSNGSSTRSDQGRMTATNISLKNLIVRAYNLKDYQVEGPDWLTSERYDMVAKFPEALPKDREKYNAALGAMMQKMLVERFKLVVRHEQKVFPVFGLIVGKNGIKFKEVPDADSHNSNSNNTHYVGTCVSMSTFAEFLSRRMERPVFDMTGLKGFYDLKLDWTENTAAGEPQQFPELAIAVQEQLGLRLESRKEPIEIVIVEHIERVPTEN
jgi:uncharacterized protein (TIGR03435 family)